MRTLNLYLAALAAVALTTGGLVVPSPNPVEAAGPTIATLPTDNPSNWTPNVLDGEVLSIWQVGDQVIIGGTFTQVANSTGNGGAIHSRVGVAAFHATTGVVDMDFAPVLDGDVEVVIPSADGSSVYLGGSFNNVDGVTRRKVAKLDVATGGLVTAFDINGVNGLVRDLRLVGDDLIVAGLFTSIGSQPRAYLASVDATTGAVNDRIDSSFLGQHNGGLTKVIKTDVTPDGSRLLVIGNFTSVDGQPRDQVALLDITQPTATVSAWSTDFFTSDCHPVFDSFLRDLDISPDGTFAVITTTGAYRAATSCDTIARLEIDAEIPDVDPTWISYTGGDTSYAAEIHDGVAYIGGHMRWVNNPYAADRHGAGGVAREGMAALDVVTGLPYSWDPGRDRGVGLFDFHVTEQGLWATSDTDRWNNELRMKLAFFPWNGGSDVSLADIGELPNDIFQLGRTSGTTGSDDPSVLYRINAGGPALESVDDGPDWEGDTSSTSPYRNSGSSSATAPNSLTTPVNHVSVPSSDLDRVPTQAWVHERWDSSNGSEMQWNFPVAAGTPIEVRLYMANRCRCTNERDERVFDVDLDGTNVIDDLDLTLQYGHDVGAMQSFDIVSDGSVDILFRHGPADNPLVNAIEIIRRDVPAGGTFGEQDQIVRQRFDGVNPPTDTTVLPGQLPWRTVRSAFMADGALYTLHVDGQIMRRSVSGSDISLGTAIDMWSNDVMADMADMTGIFYDPSTSAIYYTLAGQNSLYVRDFVAESAMIGATRSTAGGAIAALDPSRVNGMFLGLGQLWFADATTGALMKMPYANGVVSGTPSVADSSVDWRGRALFRTTTSQPNIAPVADFTATCDVNVCDVDGSISTDVDGTIAAHDWDFGDGTTDSGANVQHAFGAAGTYTIQLTVTDDRGGIDQHQIDVTVDDPANVVPTASFSANCSLLRCTFDGTGSTDSDGTIVSYEWDFGDGGSASGANTVHDYSDGGTKTITLTVTDDDGDTHSTSSDVELFGASAVAEFRAATSSNANTAAPTVTVPSEVQIGDQLIMIVTVNRSTTIQTPSGWSLLGSNEDGSPDMTSWVFHRTADAGTAGTSVSAPLGRWSKTATTMVAYSNATPPTDVTSSVMGARSFAFSTPSVDVELAGSAVVSYWSDKTSGNTGWTTPPEVTQRAAAVGSGSGHIAAAVGDTNVGAGSWPGATAMTTDDGRKGIAWSMTLAPSTGNLAPTAAWTSSCSSLSCDFDGSTSSDPDGTIISHDWDFGDGTTASGPTATHDFSASGTFNVSLTVTDDGGSSTTESATVSVATAVTEFRAGNSTNTNVTTPAVQIPVTVESGDQMVAFATMNLAVTAATPPGWTLLGIADDGAPDMRSYVFTRTADATDAGTSLDVELSARAKTSLVVVAYSNAQPVTTAVPGIATTSSSLLATEPATADTTGSIVISYWSDKTSGNTGWTVPADVTVRADSPGAGGGRITAAAGDTAVPAGPWPGRTATSTVSGAKAISWTVVVSAPTP